MVTRGPATPPATTNEPFHGTGAPNHQSGAKPAGQDLRETHPDAVVTGEGMPGWRRTFIALIIAQTMSMVAFGMALPFLPLYVQTLGVSDEGDAIRWAGVMSTTGMLVMAAVAPFWGVMADRRGRKPMVARACFGGGLIVGAMALARTPLELFGLRTLQGGFSGTVAATRTLLTSVVPASQLGFTLGIMQTAVFVGNSFGPLLGGFISDAAGYKVSFLATGALLAISGVIVMVFVRENFTPPVAADANARHGWRDAVAMIERTPGLSAVIVTLFLVSAAQNAMGPVLPLFVKTLVADAHTQIASMAGLVLGITAVTSALAAGFGGRIGDRYGHGRMMAVCAIIGGILYIPQALVTSPYELLAWRGLLGLFTGGLMPGTMAIVALRTPSAHRGWVFGLTTTATALGNAAGPMAGAAAATTLGLRATFVVTGLILTIAGVWAAWSTDRTVRAATPTP